MGREIKRVPLDFDFPINKSYHDAMWEKHRESCSENDCDHHVDTSPPKGEGWQLWQTVSDGPTTPVFKTAEELIDYMCQPDPEYEARNARFGGMGPAPWSKGWDRAAS